MAEEYVNRVEFDLLKKEVEELKKTISESQKLLQDIDKKIDVVCEKITHNDEVDKLKLDTFDSRLKKIEGSQEWLWKTVIGTVIGIVIKIIFDVSKMV